VFFANSKAISLDNDAETIGSGGKTAEIRNILLITMIYANAFL
jgi:hypothetical protein